MVHQVQQGDNLYRIGLKYGVSVQELKKWNELPNEDITTGQVLRVSNIKPLSISNFCITDSPIPMHVADHIYLYHLLELQKVEKRLGVTVSRKSGYRPKEYELSMGRSGDSQHTFQYIGYQGKRGATDITSSAPLDRLTDALIDATEYRRLCFYPKNNFVHGDYKDIDGKRRLYEYNYDKSEWEFLENI